LRPFLGDRFRSRGLVAGLALRDVFQRRYKFVEMLSAAKVSELHLQET
jgi:hypothetical protein